MPRSLPHVVREPAVAGAFYPADPTEVARWIEPEGPPAERALGALAPHAGWIYSGRLAKLVLQGTEVPEHVLVATPNHTGLGVPISLHPPGVWRFPGFEVPMDETLIAGLVDRLGPEVLDTAAHAREHAGEVLLPFLWGVQPRLRASLLTLARLDAPTCVALGEAIATTVRELDLEGAFLFVASSDMTHYMPAETAARLDALVWPHLEALDPEGLHRTVEAQGLTMCGYVPTTVMLAAVRALGARRAIRVGYTHSGVVTGDDRSVVAYAGYWFV